jgi:hypothetical protein
MRLIFQLPSLLQGLSRRSRNLFLRLLTLNLTTVPLARSDSRGTCADQFRRENSTVNSKYVVLRHWRGDLAELKEYRRGVPVLFAIYAAVCNAVLWYGG